MSGPDELDEKLCGFVFFGMSDVSQVRQSQDAENDSAHLKYRKIHELDGKVLQDRDARCPSRTADSTSEIHSPAGLEEDPGFGHLGDGCVTLIVGKLEVGPERDMHNASCSWFVCYTKLMFRDVCDAWLFDHLLLRPQLGYDHFECHVGARVVAAKYG